MKKKDAGEGANLGSTRAGGGFQRSRKVKSLRFDVRTEKRRLWGRICGMGGQLVAQSAVITSREGQARPLMCKFQKRESG